jgi:hypothetical protein
MMARGAAQLDEAARSVRRARVATALYDQLGSGPVCWADPDDEFVSRKCLAMPRGEAVAVWRGVQETSTRVPERQAL